MPKPECCCVSPATPPSAEESLLMRKDLIARSIERFRKLDAEEGMRGVNYCTPDEIETILRVQMRMAEQIGQHINPEQENLSE